MKKYIGLIIGLLPLIVSAQLVITSNNYVVLSGGSSSSPTTLVLTNPAPGGISNTATGWIISENEFNEVQWNIGTNTGTYTVPFGFSTTSYLPLTLDIGTAGVGGSGVIKFSTYHSAALNSGDEPSDVTNMTPFILPGSPSNTDNSYNVADRFYDIDVNTGYTTKPAAGNITFSYISGTGNTEVGSPNTLTESRMMAQRFNSGTGTWSDWFGEGCTDAVVSNVGTVQTGAVTASNMYRSWSLWDQTMSLPLKVTSIGVSCNGGANGTAASTVYGGVSPYHYTWSSGQTTGSASGLSAGTYTLSVTDNNGCSSTVTVTLTQPAVLGVTTTVTGEVSCTGVATGSISAGSSGGTSPYTYSWSGGGTSSTKTGLSAGTYTVTLKDNHGCTTTASAVITQAAGLTLTLDSTDVSTSGACDGRATVGAVGSGTAPYTYLWSDGSSQTTVTATGLCAGMYCVQVTDRNGCSASACVSVVTGIPTLSNSSNIKIYPNPNTGIFTITGLSQGQVIEIYDYLGQNLSSSKVGNSATMHFDISTKANGVYLIRIQGKDGVLIGQQKIVKTQ